MISMLAICDSSWGDASQLLDRLDDLPVPSMSFAQDTSDLPNVAY